VNSYLSVLPLLQSTNEVFVDCSQFLTEVSKRSWLL